MNKKLERSLRDMQANPTTGTAHNHQLISTQVETIFSLYKLQEEISKLSLAVKNADKQSQRLERSNYRLQLAMVILTAIATLVVVYPIAHTFIASFFTPNVFGFSLTAAIVSLFAALISGFLAGAVIAKEKNIIDKVLKIDNK